MMGDGKLGLLCCEVLGRQGLEARPVLFGKHEHKMALVADVVEGVHVDKAGEHAGRFDVRRDGLGCRLLLAGCLRRVAVAGEPFRADCAPTWTQVVVDATGSPAGLDLARSLVRPMGTIVLKSTCAAAGGFNAGARAKAPLAPIPPHPPPPVPPTTFPSQRPW